MKKIMILMFVILCSCAMKEKPVVLSNTLKLEMKDDYIKNEDIEIVKLKEMLPANFDFRVLSCDEKKIGFGVWESGKFAAYQYDRFTREINAINKYEVSVFIESFSYSNNLYLLFLKFEDNGYQLQLMNQSDDILELNYRVDKVPYVEMIDNELFFTCYEKTEDTEEELVMSYSFKNKQLKEIIRFSSPRYSEDHQVISCLGGMDSMLYFQVVEFVESEVEENRLYSYDLRSHELKYEVWNETLDYVNGTKRNLFTATNTFHQQLEKTHKIIDYDNKAFTLLPRNDLAVDYVDIQEIDYHDVLLATNKECYILSDNVLRKIIELDQINDILVYQDNILIVGGGKIYILENETFRKQKFKEAVSDLKREWNDSEVDFLYETGDYLYYLESNKANMLAPYQAIVWEFHKTTSEFLDVERFNYESINKNESKIKDRKYILDVDSVKVEIEIK